MEVVSGGRVAPSVLGLLVALPAWQVDVEAVPRDQSLDFLPSSEKAVCSLQTPMLSAPPLVF